MVIHKTKTSIFLKLGGSLITDKDQPRTPRLSIIRELLEEIAIFRLENPDIDLILGHGSGSFGHRIAHQYNTREGVNTPHQWEGFSLVWNEARALNTIIIDECNQIPSLSAISFPASSAAITDNGKVCHWDITPLQHALEHRLLPVVFGDVVFDNTLGGTILSTEEIFYYLASILHPDRILIAGIEPGVWCDFPENTDILPLITPDLMTHIRQNILGSNSIDVTGGMLEKVNLLLTLCKQNPVMRGQIFSGLEKSTVFRVLNGETVGTIIYINNDDDINNKQKGE